jgi:hypothetical protein
MQGCHCSSSACASQNHFLQIVQRTVGVEGIGDFDSDVHQLFLLDRTIGDDVLEGFAFEEGAAGLFADVINRTDIRVIQRRGSFQVMLES